jgi:uncharacterized protein YukE
MLYDEGAISAATAAINSFYAAMNSELDRLKAEFAPAFNGEWEGEAGEACKMAKQQWDALATETTEAQARVGRQLGIGASDMFGLDKSIAAGLS